MFHKEKNITAKGKCLDYESLKREVNQFILGILHKNPYEAVGSKGEIERIMKFKQDLRKAIRGGSVGNYDAKIFIRDFIKDILVVQLKLTEEQLDRILPFGNSFGLVPRDKFAILLYHYGKSHGRDALEVLMEQYQLDSQKSDETGEPYYEVSAQDIHEIYQEEGMILLSYVDKVNIVAQRIYEDTKGNGPIDELFYLRIDGISGGVSGTTLLESEFSFQEGKSYSYQSIWVFYHGKSIHFSFLEFSSQKELIRICRNIYRFQNPGQLSQRKGYMINEMADGSRIAVARPPFCEGWVFFIRKFDSVRFSSMEELLRDEGKELPVHFMKWAVKGCQNIGITGEQGSGKTTLLMALVAFIRPWFNLRVQENAFELHLRKMYPKRNIVSFQETNFISGQSGLDFQKKTDGAVHILGEVASNKVCSWMIQMAQVASDFTVFTHHAKTTKDLLYSFRNALLMEGGFSEERIALEQVLHAVQFDIHMRKTEKGHRYIERITEIRERTSDYTGSSANMFEICDIIRYENGRYKLVNSLSKEAKRRILDALDGEEKKEFLIELDRWREQEHWEKRI
ncbi:ATPase, T2SS/T4P/T4SS family [[Clostridium] polysaccharolyticum]|uniref:Pilus assembly protein CpaF n=1 Tax=[Clostridium] polysaccharolyticum TaxID=29364 RepID=A0A1H9YQV8_9FIRM|nr:ATPase, T2SS/T4P/T4SS family [[Clostridium] polysaccharolyticum]SES71437.1 pilus assembly protein CpaF [[Clostridium] polysaccharolyticum]